MCKQYENIYICSVNASHHTQNLHTMQTVFFAVIALMIFLAIVLAKGLQSPDQISKY
jgi:hypothetical protein